MYTQHLGSKGQQLLRTGQGLKGDNSARHVAITEHIERQRRGRQRLGLGEVIAYPGPRQARRTLRRIPYGQWWQDVFETTNELYAPFAVFSSEDHLLYEPCRQLNSQVTVKSDQWMPRLIPCWRSIVPSMKSSREVENDPEGHGARL